MINDILITSLKKITHPKGDLFHIMKRNSAGYLDFGEAYISTIKEKEVKGWKKHERMTMNIVVPYGKVLIVMYDDRDNSLTRGQFQEIELSLDNYVRLTVPPMLWVGFLGKSKDQSMIINIADIEHDNSESSSLNLEEIPYQWG